MLRASCHPGEGRGLVFFFSRARLKLAIQTKKMVVEQNWTYLKALNIGISTWVNTTEKLGDNIHQISLETR